MLVPLRFIIISMVFFYLSNLLFSGFLPFKGNFVCGQNVSKYRDWAPLTATVLFTLDPDRALNSSQQVKDDGIVMVGLGISPVKKEMLQKIVSSQDQVVIFPPFEPDLPVKEDITSEVTTMLCEGIYKIGEILHARSLVDRCV